MLASFNEEAQYILLKSKTEMLNLNHPYIGSEHLVLSILKVENKTRKAIKDTPKRNLLKNYLNMDLLMIHLKQKY